VTAAANDAKADADPSNWVPSNVDFACEYLADWISIKVRWTLSMDEAEHGRVRNLLTDQCQGQLIAPWPSLPPTTTTVPPATAPPPTAPAETVPAQTEPPAVQPAVPLRQERSGDCDPSYPTVRCCGDSAGSAASRMSE